MRVRLLALCFLGSPKKIHTPKNDIAGLWIIYVPPFDVLYLHFDLIMHALRTTIDQFYHFLAENEKSDVTKTCITKKLIF